MSISLDTFTHNPWWLWVVGFTGTFGLTVNVIIFPKIGSIQTTVLPLSGQIFAGTLVDQFGWFDAPISKINLLKLLGLLLVLAGMLLTTHFTSNSVSPTDHDRSPQLQWQLLGMFAGMVTGFQTAIIGHLGAVLHSPIKKATFVAFLMGAIILSIVTIALLKVPVKKHLQSVSHSVSNGEWWGAAGGGICGSLYVLLSAWLVPLIGTGQVIVIALFGQLLFSAIIDQVGLLYAARRAISLVKVIGLVTMLFGVIIIRFVA